MCTSCGGLDYSAKNKIEFGECTYTTSQLQIWKNLLLCAKENQLANEFELNKGLGIVESALRREDVCYYQGYLNGINPLIIQIIALNQCP